MDLIRKHAQHVAALLYSCASSGSLGPTLARHARRDGALTFASRAETIVHAHLRAIVVARVAAGRFVSDDACATDLKSYVSAMERAGARVSGEMRAVS